MEEQEKKTPIYFCIIKVKGQGHSDILNTLSFNFITEKVYELLEGVHAQMKDKDTYRLWGRKIKGRGHHEILFSHFVVTS